MSSQPDFISIEIMDTFPQDHPYLFTDPNSSEEAKKMQEQLKHIIENKPIEDPEHPNSTLKWINAFIFVYNSAEPETF